MNQFHNRIESLEWERKEVEDRKTKVTLELQANRTERTTTLTRVEDLNGVTQSTLGDLDAARTREEELAGKVTEARTCLAVEQGTRRSSKSSESRCLPDSMN